MFYQKKLNNKSLLFLAIILCFFFLPSALKAQDEDSKEQQNVTEESSNEKIKEFDTQEKSKNHQIFLGGGIFSSTLEHSSFFRFRFNKVEEKDTSFAFSLGYRYFFYQNGKHSFGFGIRYFDLGKSEYKFKIEDDSYKYSIEETVTAPGLFYQYGNSQNINFLIGLSANTHDAEIKIKNPTNTTTSDFNDSGLGITVGIAGQTESQIGLGF